MGSTAYVEAEVSGGSYLSIPEIQIYRFKFDKTRNIYEEATNHPMHASVFCLCALAFSRGNFVKSS